MESIFRVSWKDLALGDLKAFLEHAGDEGIVWEAKAADPRKKDAKISSADVREPICGLANSMGGYVIVGAVRDKESQKWSLPGVVFPHDEPGTWLDDVVETIRPRPKTDSRVWEVDSDRTVAVIQIEPVGVPPCMTAGGQIYERTSGKTVRVTDPLVLARLYERGAAATENARAWADRVVKLLRETSLRSDNRGLIVTIGLRATGYDPDISSRLFRASTSDLLAEIVARHLKKDRYTANTLDSSRIAVQQDRVSVFTTHGDLVGSPEGGDRMWQVTALWNGAVGINCEGNDREIGIGMLFDDVVVPALRTAAEIVPLVGGYGNAHLVLDVASTINTGHEEWGVGNVHGGPIERDLASLNIDATLVDDLKRELFRSMGHPAWEPEPEP